MTFCPLTSYSDFPTNLSTNFMTLTPSFLKFTELRGISMEHLQRLWQGSRELLPFRTHGSDPLLGTCLCSNFWDQFSRTCSVLSRLFTLIPLGTFSIWISTNIILPKHSYDQVDQQQIGNHHVEHRHCRDGPVFLGTSLSVRVIVPYGPVTWAAIQFSICKFF